jgi:hypothetical protein
MSSCSFWKAARALLAASRHGDALADMEPAIRFVSERDRHRVLVLRAHARKGLGDWAGARADFAAAVAAWPSVASDEQFRRRRAAEAALPAACQARGWLARRRGAIRTRVPCGEDAAGR